MNWYYVEQGKQAGPANDEEFNALLQSGAITADTLVWREGMAEWRPYGRLQQQGMSTGETATATEATTQGVCVECGSMFPAEETIRYGDVRVCANCKPVFLQKLQEGAELQTGVFNYAGFWIRLLAFLLDFAILMGVGVVVRLAVLAASGLFIAGTHGNPEIAIAALLFMSAFQFGLPVAYETVMVGRYGATLGKMALKLRVVVADGQPMSYARSFGRTFAKILSMCPTFFIGCIIAGFDIPEKRALHDYICNTRVMHK